MKSAITCLVLLIALSSFGCASSGSNAEKRRQIAIQEVSRMMQPSRKLGGFAQYELKPLTMSPEVRENEKKVAYAEKLEEMIEVKISPLLDEWRSSGRSSTGTLAIQPEVARLKIVSGGARFWAGAWAGTSQVDLTLKLIDQASGEIIASPRIDRSSDAMAGAWSGGATDQNLLRYIVDITYQYLVENY
jgi:hypothetical protein